MQRLPIGIQTFSEIRGESYCYVDKTHLIHRMVREGKHYFLARPRRFGKSLLVDTISEAFRGGKEYFRGLYLENRWDFDAPHPVILLDFAEGVLQSRQELDEAVLLQLRDVARDYGLSIDRESGRPYLRELIRRLHAETGRKTVVLVDEYDKPILDNLTEPERAREMREGLRDLYSVLKAQDAHLRFVLLTGVSKFSKVSLFSGLNNLEDITLDPRYATLCGYTQAELEQVFALYLDGVDTAEVRRWYNGYNFLGEAVYNPYDVMRYLRTGIFRSFWFETGTPTFLIDLLRDRRYYIPALDDLYVGEELLGSFDVDYIQPETLLFQTGCVTVREQVQQGRRIKYRLGYPNREVQISLTDAILNAYAPDIQQKETTQNRVYRALETADLPAFEEALSAFFASIPHDWYRNNHLAEYEGYYCSLAYCYITALGIPVIPEDVSHHGRVDMTVFCGGRIYVMEFKVTELAGTGRALEQIRRKRYHAKYRGNRAVLVGIEMSSAERNIHRFEWEETDR